MAVTVPYRFPPTLGDVHPRNRTLLAWSLWSATMACLLGGLLVTLAVVRPLTTEVIVDGAFEGSFWFLFATIGLVLTLRRPANPIGWLYAAAGLVWTLSIPWDPWVDQLLRTGRPLPPAARLVRRSEARSAARMAGLAERLASRPVSGRTR